MLFLQASSLRSVVAALSVGALALGPIAPVAMAEEGEESADYGYGKAGPTRAPIDLRASGSRTAPQGQVARALALRQQAAVELTQVAAADRGDSAERATPRPAWLERERVEAPYQAGGVLFIPTAEPGYEQVGTASWYGAELAGRRTASGERFDPGALTGAHPTLPLPSLVQVTNLATGAEVVIRINDRGPFTGGRIIDVSQRAAEVLGFKNAGEAEVHVRYLGPAPKRVDPAQARAGVRQTAPVAPATTQQAPSATDGGLFVQVGAFASMANAQRARDAIAPIGPARIVASQRGEQALQLVRLGPLSSRQAAESARAAARDAGFSNAAILTASR